MMGKSLLSDADLLLTTNVDLCASIPFFRQLLLSFNRTLFHIFDSETSEFAARKSLEKGYSDKMKKNSDTSEGFLYSKYMWLNNHRVPQGRLVLPTVYNPR